METASHPKLQKPGAGLPLPQMLFLRLWLEPVTSRRTPLSQSRANYERAVEKLLEKIAAVPADRRTTRVLVAPMAGLEDSSRYWSLNEVLEHLLIVTSGMDRIIRELCADRVPDIRAETAAVKPRGQNQDQLERFRAAAPDVLRKIDEEIGEAGLRSPLRFRHPWFGPITARQWYWMLGVHTSLHYRQAKAILAGLGAAA